jgi:hypothetical protein
MGEKKFIEIKQVPLARNVIVQQQVQGLDYAYTLEGWLKGVNSTSLNPTYDMGVDGAEVARDAYGFSLNYFTGDYSAINSSISPFPGFSGLMPSGYYKPLYNGNISAMAVNINKLDSPLLYNYQYDQLNRIVAMDAFTGLNQSTNTWSSPLTLTNNYKERVTYDANGNILKYYRNGTTWGGTPLGMDSLTYKYNLDTHGQLANNKLMSVKDSVPSGNYPNDIDNQIGNNNAYDSIGNLVKDSAGGISSITWTIYGKISNIAKADGSTVAYTYDAAGNRISKTVTPASGPGTITWYVRDASGNTMAVYTATGSDSLYQSEQHLYGSNRLGIFNRNINVDAALPTGTSASLIGSYFTPNFTRGNKLFELSNHLGNVLVTISDKKLGVDTNSDGTVDYYTADVVSANDYYPGGMDMPGRSYSIANTNYRYGYGDHEKLDEIYGSGNTIDLGGRLLDTRLGRTPSPDPEKQLYPGTSPYVYAIDNPINVIDPDGKLVIFINGQNLGDEGGKSSYWEGVDLKIMRQIGDYNAIYRDGSSGGFINTLFSFNFLKSNLNPGVRIRNGYKQGMLDAANIINKLRRDPNDPNKITESIKIVTHSMGTAYSRGYTAALEDYVSNYNKNNPNSKLKDFKIEIQVDIAAYQGSDLPADKNVQISVNMNGDKDNVANGKGKGKEGALLRLLSPSSTVPDSKEITTLPGITHSIKDFGADYDIRQIPKSSDAIPPLSPYRQEPAASDHTSVSNKPYPEKIN